MEIDARKSARDDLLEADLCIVGAGPVGIVLAHELIDSSSNVVLLESGGLDADEAVQELSCGTIVGDSLADPRRTRHRQAGGTVHLWNTPVGAEIGAKFVPLDPVDLERRDGFPLSGWPFDRSHLLPFYRRAQTVCGLGRFEYGAPAWTDATHRALALEGAALTSAVYQLASRRLFARIYPARLREASNVCLCHHATVLGLDTDAGARRIREARVALSGGGHLRVRARVFVLAAGAIENARLLLLSNATLPDGPGNRFGWVGRCFMEHPRDYSLTLVPRSPSFFADAIFYDSWRTEAGDVVMGRLALRDRTLRESDLTNVSATLLPTMPAKPRAREALVALLRRLRPGRAPTFPRRRGYPRGGGGWSRIEEPARAFDAFRLLLNLEQAPHPDNRIVLSSRHDALGQPAVEIHWRWRDADRRQLQRIREIVTRDLEAAGLGRVEVDDDAAPDPNAHHHAGTTRMHVDPRFGVVDADARVHDLDNLYVAGASVFPTAGFANPMLTVVALTLRLADYLKAAL